MSSFSPITARNLIEAQRQLISKLEKDCENSVSRYESIISSQNSLISKMEKRYNEMLNSLLESFDEIEGNAYANNVDEIQSDLNNLIQKLNEIKENDLIEKPLSVGLDASPMFFNSFAKNFRSFSFGSGKSITNLLTNDIKSNDNSLIIEQQNVSSIEMEANNNNVSLQDFNSMEANELELNSSSNVNDLDSSYLNDKNQLYIPATRDFTNNLQPFDDSFDMLKHQVYLAEKNLILEQNQSECEESPKKDNHLQELFSAHQVKPQIDFDCQCDLAKEEYDSAIEQMRQEFLDSNLNLQKQIDAKNNEIKDLNAIIKLLEENQLNNERKLNEAEKELQESTITVAEKYEESESIQAKSDELIESKRPSPEKAEIDLCYEINSLEDLIKNYLNLIKSYKTILDKLNSVKIDNSQLKVSYNSLNSKYLKLKSENTTSKINEINENLDKNLLTKDEAISNINNLNKQDSDLKIECENAEKQFENECKDYENLIEIKYNQQLDNLKHAYNQLILIYDGLKNNYHSNYNKLHDKYLKHLQMNATNIPEEDL